MPKRTKAGPAGTPAGKVIQANAHLEGSLYVAAGAEDVRRYLAETGLAIEDVLAAHRLEGMPGHPHARERWTEAEIATAENLGSQLIELERWAWLAGRIQHPEAPEHPERLPAAEGAAVLEALAAMPPLPFNAALPTTVLQDEMQAGHPTYRDIEAGRSETRARLLEVSPTYRDAHERREALEDKARLSPAELRERIAERLTRPDGTVAPSPAEWCTRTGARFDAFGNALFLEFFTQTIEERDSFARHRTLLSPPLRVGSRTAKTYSIQPGAPWRDTLKRLKKAKAISSQDLQKLEQDEPVPLKGDELLVVAGLLELARREPGFRAYGPTSARVGNYTLDARFLVPKPRLEEFCRLLGYEPTNSGTMSGGDRGKVLRALEALSKTSRPIVVRQWARTGKQWEETFLVARDLPIRDDGEHYALHASLFDGFFHGHLTFNRVPQQWDAARKAIGRRNITDEMKWGDVYFRRLALGVVTQSRREFVAKRSAKLVAEGMAETAAKGRAAVEWRGQKPPTLEKKLRTETLLAELNLTEWREKRGPVATRETLEDVLEFAKAVEGCPVQAWEWTGTGKLPAKLTLTLKTPDAASDPDEEIEQGELFAALGPGNSAQEVTQ